MAAPFPWQPLITPPATPITCLPVSDTSGCHYFRYAPSADWCFYAEDYPISPESVPIHFGLQRNQFVSACLGTRMGEICGWMGGWVNNNIARWVPKWLREWVKCTVKYICVNCKMQWLVESRCMSHGGQR